MPCYLLRAGPTDMVKIGFAVEVESRIIDLQAGCWERLCLLRQWPGGRETEGWLHKKFRAHRVDRDWFRFHPDMMDAVPPEEDDGSHPVRQIIDDVGGASVIARALGLPTARVGKWRERASIPARYHLAILLLDEKLTAEQMVSAHARNLNNEDFP